MNRAKREFHYEDGKSDKFWTIELQGNTHILNWGRAGTLGQHLEKPFDSAIKAQFEYEKIVKEKTKKVMLKLLLENLPTFLLTSNNQRK